jgi:putative ATP-binding cassette transporter
VFLDDAIGALDEEHRRRVLSIFERELPGAAVIRLGREPAQDGFWTRTLHIIERPDGPCLRSGPEPPGPDSHAALAWLKSRPNGEHGS